MFLCGTIRKLGIVGSEGSWQKTQLCGGFLKVLGTQMHLSPNYILWHFFPKGIQKNSRNGTVNLQCTLVRLIDGSKTKISKAIEVVILE